MQLSRTLARVLMPYLLGIALFLGSYGIASAAQRRAPQEAAPPPTKSYVIQYGIVIFGIGIGLMLVCGTSKRAEQPKFDDDQEL